MFLGHLFCAPGIHASIDQSIYQNNTFMLLWSPAPPTLLHRLKCAARLGSPPLLLRRFSLDGGTALAMEGGLRAHHRGVWGAQRQRLPNTHDLVRPGERRPVCGDVRFGAAAVQCLHNFARGEWFTRLKSDPAACALPACFHLVCSWASGLHASTAPACQPTALCVLDPAQVHVVLPRRQADRQVQRHAGGVSAR